MEPFDLTMELLARHIIRYIIVNLATSTHSGVELINLLQKLVGGGAAELRDARELG